MLNDLILSCFNLGIDIVGFHAHQLWIIDWFI